MMKDPTKVKEMEVQVKKRVEEGQKQLEAMKKATESEATADDKTDGDSKPSSLN